MVMSQGTYTFLVCFAGFWLLWALVVMLCCFCSFARRRLKRRQEERRRRREQSLRSLDAEPEPPQGPPPPSLLPHTAPRGSWTSPPEADVFGKPPCYEEAVQMEDPPPPYSEVLADPRAGTCSTPASGMSRKPQDGEMSKTTQDCVFLDGAYPPLIHLPVQERWDSLGCLLSTVDLNRNNLAVEPRGPPFAASFSDWRTDAQQGFGRPSLEDACALPTAFPLFGRSTAV